MNNSKTNYQQKIWSRTDLFPSSDGPEIQNAFSNLEAQITSFEEKRSLLTENISVEDFLSIIQQMEEISKIMHRLGSYAGLWFSEDTQNQAAQSFMARIELADAEINNRILFFNLWWKKLSDDSAERLMAQSGDYRYWLEEIRHFKKYTLSEPEEKIINIKDVNGASALNTLYASITNRYIFKLEVDGEMKELSRGELMVYARHHDPDLRARAYQELYRVYGEDGPILGQIYQALVRDWGNEQVKLRGHESAISPRNLANDIPDDVVETLLKVCEQNAPVFQRFFKLKANWLGIEKLNRYDVYAPVVKSDKTYTYSEAVDLVLSSYNQFDPEFAKLAERVFAEDHLDSEVRKGKRSGAFCMPALPELTPWVLLNYQGKASDVSTMAHELGHAIHSMLSEHHSLFTYHSCLPLAETASIFGEMALVDRLLKEETDESVRRDLLFTQVDDAYATIIRQAFFALFEKQAHEMIVNGASVDELAEAYLENLRTQFGDSVNVNDEFRWEWVSIPHIYNVPFYVYAYTFGQLLVLSLYQQFRQEGETFIPRYKKILSSGGAEAPVKVLAEAGINIHEASFWQGGFDVVNNLVDQLEALPIEK